MFVEAQLHTLSAEYAAAVDAQDADRLCALFTGDGELFVPGPTPWILHGHAELATLPSGLAGFTRTLHFVGQGTYRLSGDDQATGEVACKAHHLVITGDVAKDQVWMMRYHDTYRRDGGTWLFARREIELLWTEDRPAEVPPS